MLRKFILVQKWWIFWTKETQNLFFKIHLGNEVYETVHAYIIIIIQ